MLLLWIATDSRDLRKVNVCGDEQVDVACELRRFSLTNDCSDFVDLDLSHRHFQTDVEQSCRLDPRYSYRRSVSTGRTLPVTRVQALLAAHVATLPPSRVSMPRGVA